MDRWLDSVLFVFTDSFMFCREESMLVSSAPAPPVPSPVAGPPALSVVAVSPAPLSAPAPPLISSALFYSQTEPRQVCPR